jgi:6-phospho-3-hexuloisomerase
VVIQVPAPSPKADRSGDVRTVQPMGSLFEQSLFLLLDAIVVELMQRRKTTSEQMFRRHANLE